MKVDNYFGLVLIRCMSLMQCRFSFLFKISALLLLFGILAVNQVKADKNPDEEIVTPLAYDEFPVQVIVNGYDNFYVDVIFTNKKVLFVNVEDLFRTLNIPCIPGQKRNTLGGFIESDSKTYLIDYDAREIHVGTKIVNSKTGMTKEVGSIYLESSLFSEAFGLSLTFNFRTLSIVLKSDFELPVIKQLRIDKMRNNISKLQGKEIADTVLQRNYNLFKFGTLDWLASTTQTWNKSTDNHFGLAIFRPSLKINTIF